MKRSISKVKFFMKNYRLVSLIFTILGVFMFFDVEEELKWLALIPFTIGTILIPVLSCASYEGHIQ